MLSPVRLFVTSWTVAHQASLSLEFSRQESWSGLPFPPPGDLPNLEIQLTSLFTSSAVTGKFFTTSTTSEAIYTCICICECICIYISWTKSSFGFFCSTYTQLLRHVWLCNPMDCSPPGSPVHGIFQARILEWVAISSSRGSSQPRDWTHVSCIGRWILYHSATWEALLF